MDEKKAKYNFDAEVLEKMDQFAKDFLSNGYKKDVSVNNGPDYKNGIAQIDTEAFEEYLESDFAEEFLKLS